MGRPVVHFEVGCRDTAKAGEFFTKLFDWTTEQMGPALMVKTGSESGIQGHFTALGHEPYHYVTFYVEVDDLQAYLKKAETLGGKTVVPPVEIPNYGSFAWLADIDGNVIGLWKPAAR
jgi:predicted enzyme related to lactoylglutathione lyase